MIIEEGLTSAGLPTADEREFRPPKDNNYNPITEALKNAIVFLGAFVCGIAVASWRLLYRLLFQKPVSLKGRVCFVTGSGRGLGREICLGLAREGAIVACAEINDVTNAETLELIKKEGGKGFGYKLNVANKQDVEEVARQVEKELGPVYLVVNNAAIIMPVKEPTEDFVRASFNVNVLGYYWVIGAFLPYLKDRNEGHIVNIGSITSYYGFPFLCTYSSTKAAVQGYTKALSLQLRLENNNNRVRISCINPTFLNTTEDYQKMMDSSIKYSTLGPVVDDLLHVVKCDWYSDISSPSYMKPTLHISQLLPDEVMLYSIKMVTRSVLYPSKEEFEKLPPGRLVRLCAGAGSKKEE